MIGRWKDKKPGGRPAWPPGAGQAWPHHLLSKPACNIILSVISLSFLSLSNHFNILPFFFHYDFNLSIILSNYTYSSKMTLPLSDFWFLQRSAEFSWSLITWTNDQWFEEIWHHQRDKCKDKLKTQITASVNVIYSQGVMHFVWCLSGLDQWLLL